MMGHTGKTLIVGLGKTGLSCARYLAAQGVAFAVTDSREAPPGLALLREEMPDLAIFLGGFKSEVFEAASRLVVSPGVSLQEPQIQAAMQRGVEVLGDIELFARVVDAPVIAITGSNGKSTVTTLVGEMARIAGIPVAIGGNLGSPALDLLNDAVQLYVLELSSFQLETTRSLKAAAAVVLNISADHMDRYPDLAHYMAAKAVIYQGAEQAIINRDDPRVVQLAEQNDALIGFSLNTPHEADFGVSEIEQVPWLCQGTLPLLPVSELRMAGRHNLANALAALALGTAVGLPMAAMLRALRTFTGLPHRTQFVASKRELRWYNDSKGTNVGATLAALQGLHPAEGDSLTVLIAGGDCKGADFSELAPVVERTARAVILIGRDAPAIAAVLQGRTKLVQVKTLFDAVQQAVELAEPGDRVLLSPACASFDMFANFEERGQAFVDAVEALAA